MFPTSLQNLFLAMAVLSVTGFSNTGAEVVKILIQGDTQKIMDAANGKQDNFVPLMAKLLTDPVTRDAARRPSEGSIENTPV